MAYAERYLDGVSPEQVLMVFEKFGGQKLPAQKGLIGQYARLPKLRIYRSTDFVFELRDKMFPAFSPLHINVEKIERGCKVSAFTNMWAFLIMNLIAIFLGLGTGVIAYWALSGNIYLRSGIIGPGIGILLGCILGERQNRPKRYSKLLEEIERKTRQLNGQEEKP